MVLIRYKEAWLVVKFPGVTWMRTEGTNFRRIMPGIGLTMDNLTMMIQITPVISLVIHVLKLGKSRRKRSTFCE